MLTQLEKARAFRALHEREGAFVLPNPYDAGTARLLAHMGFEALATTSAGYAFSAGKPDHGVGRDAMLRHIAVLTAAVDLPISGDLENGYGHAPAEVAETVLLAAQAGLVGCSIEDDSGIAGKPIYDFGLAVERIEAAAEAARSLPFPFTLTARAENFLHGRHDLDDTVRRLQAFQQAGADVLYAPGLTRKEEIEVVVRSVDRPVNVLAGLGEHPLDLSTLAAIGVKRVSVGAALARAALGEFLLAAHEMRNLGTFTFTKDAARGADLNQIFAKYNGLS
jgi:2-methylisocitrate lyase-like PEP mutase family enzyme